MAQLSHSSLILNYISYTIQKLAKSIFHFLTIQQNESECHCEGQDFMQIPQNLKNVTRLSIANARFRALRVNGLKIYSTMLKDM